MEWIDPVKSEIISEDYVPWVGEGVHEENSLFTKTIRNVLMRGATSITKKLSVDSHLPARVVGRRGGYCSLMFMGSMEPGIKRAR